MYKDLLAPGTVICTGIAIIYLWAYLRYLGRPDLLVPSLGDVRALFVLFAVSMLCFPWMLLVLSLPAIVLVKSVAWIRQTFRTEQHTAFKFALIVQAIVIIEATIYVGRKAFPSYVGSWTNDIWELFAALPILVGLSLWKYRTYVYTGRTMDSHLFWQTRLRRAMPGMLVWLNTMAVCVSAGQILADKDIDLVDGFMRAKFFSCLLLGAGLGFMYWRERAPQRTDALKKSFFLSTLILTVALFFCPQLFETTMKNVAYAIGMRDRHVDGIVLGSPYEASDFGASWQGCALGDKKILLWGRKMFSFGKVLLICPGNYTYPTTKQMQECSKKECLALSPDEVKSWIGPSPARCPRVVELKVKRDECRN